MAWMELIIAEILEVFRPTMMKWGDGFSKINYSFYTVIGMIASSYFLSRAVRSLPMSLSYPIWIGTGTVGLVIIGVVSLYDKLNLSTWFFMGMLLISIIGIKITNGHQTPVISTDQKK